MAISERIRSLKDTVEEAKKNLRSTMTTQELGKESIREIIADVANTQAYISALFGKDDDKLATSTKILKEELTKLVEEGADADSARLREIQKRAKDIAKIAQDEGGPDADYVGALADSLSGGAGKAGKIKTTGVGVSDMFGSSMFSTIFGDKFSKFVLGGPESVDGKGGKRDDAELRLRIAEETLAAESNIDGISPSEVSEERREDEVREKEVEVKEDKVIGLLQEILSRLGGGGSFMITGGGAGGGGGGGEDEGLLSDEQGLLASMLGGQAVIQMAPWLGRMLFGTKGASIATSASTQWAATIGGRSVMGMATTQAATRAAFMSFGIGALGFASAGIGTIIWGLGEAMIGFYQKKASDLEASHGYFMGYRHGAGGRIYSKATDTMVYDPQASDLYEGQRGSDRRNRGWLLENEDLITQQIEIATMLRASGDHTGANKMMGDAGAAMKRRASLVSKLRGAGGQPLTKEETESELRFNPDNWESIYSNLVKYSDSIDGTEFIDQSAFSPTMKLAYQIQGIPPGLTRTQRYDRGKLEDTSFGHDIEDFKHGRGRMLQEALTTDTMLGVPGRLAPKLQNVIDEFIMPDIEEMGIYQWYKNTNEEKRKQQQRFPNQDPKGSRFRMMQSGLTPTNVGNMTALNTNANMRFDLSGNVAMSGQQGSNTLFAPSVYNQNQQTLVAGEIIDDQHSLINSDRAELFAIANYSV